MKFGEMLERAVSISLLLASKGCGDRIGIDEIDEVIEEVGGNLEEIEEPSQFAPGLGRRRSDDLIDVDLPRLVGDPRRDRPVAEREGGDRGGPDLGRGVEGGAILGVIREDRLGRGET